MLLATAACGGDSSTASSPVLAMSASGGTWSSVAAGTSAGAVSGSGASSAGAVGSAPVLAIGSRDLASSRLIRPESRGRETLGKAYNRLLQAYGEAETVSRAAA